jgi:hypothetical protein
VVVPSEAIEIIRPEPIPIAHFDTIGPALRQCSEEFIQVSNEIATVFVIGRPEPGKFKHQQADGMTNRLARLQERFCKQFRIEKILIGAEAV